MKYLQVVILLFILITLGSCLKREDLVITGMSPVYVDHDDFSGIRTEEPRAYENLGGIVNVGDFIFLVERYKGIHVVDNSIPSNPVDILFWQIPGCVSFTIEDNTLYVNNTRHLLVLDISDPTNIQYLSYIEDLYLEEDPVELRPPFDYAGYFYCANQNEGIVIDWEIQELINPRCQAF